MDDQAKLLLMHRKIVQYLEAVAAGEWDSHASKETLEQVRQRVGYVKRQLEAGEPMAPNIALVLAGVIEKIAEWMDRGYIRY